MPQRAPVARSFAQGTQRVHASPPPLHQVRAETSRPSTEYCQHHDVAEPRVDATAFHPGWRLSTRLDRLLVAGEITREAWQAGDAFRTTWERANGIGMVRELELRARVAIEDRLSIGRLDAAAWLRRVSEALGRNATWLIERCVVQDASWRETAKRLRISDKTAQSWTATVLQSLADHLAGRPVVDLPRERYRNEPDRM